MHVPYIRPLHEEQCVIVDVFLPKKLVNQAHLISVLTKTLDFAEAHKYLIANASELHAFWDHLPRGEDSFELRADTDSEPQTITPEELSARIRQIRRRIAGYSIFEVDGAFEPTRLHRTSVIPIADRSEPLRPAKGLAAKAKRAFVKKLPDFAKLIGKAGALHPHPSWPERETHRILVSEESRDEVEHGNGSFTFRRCVTVIEERVLMIRFITMPDDEDRKTSDPLARVLWDTLMVVGCYFARQLGVTMEDEIWITYDTRSTLWRWKQHDGAGFPIEATRAPQ